MNSERRDCGNCRHTDERAMYCQTVLGCSAFTDDNPVAWEPQETTPEGVNPKELAGAKKPSTWSVMPRWIVLLVGRVMSIGAAKYGAFNYRETSISASVYQDAMERHLQLWFDGEDNDPETQVSHLASVIASCALLLDAQATGKLHDDRQKTGIVRPKLEALEALIGK